MKHKIDFKKLIIVVYYRQGEVLCSFKIERTGYNLNSRRGLFLWIFKNIDRVSTAITKLCADTGLYLVIVINKEFTYTTISNSLSIRHGRKQLSKFIVNLIKTKLIK